MVDAEIIGLAEGLSNSSLYVRLNEVSSIQDLVDSNVDEIPKYVLKSLFQAYISTSYSEKEWRVALHSLLVEMLPAADVQTSRDCVSVEFITKYVQAFLVASKAERNNDTMHSKCVQVKMGCMVIESLYPFCVDSLSISADIKQVVSPLIAAVAQLIGALMDVLSVNKSTSAKDYKQAAGYVKAMVIHYNKVINVAKRSDADNTSEGESEFVVVGRTFSAEDVKRISSECYCSLVSFLFDAWCSPSAPSHAALRVVYEVVCVKEGPFYHFFSDRKYSDLIVDACDQKLQALAANAAAPFHEPTVELMVMLPHCITQDQWDTRVENHILELLKHFSSSTPAAALYAVPLLLALLDPVMNTGVALDKFVKDAGAHSFLSKLFLADAVVGSECVLSSSQQQGLVLFSALLARCGGSNLDLQSLVDGVVLPLLTRSTVGAPAKGVVVLTTSQKLIMYEVLKLLGLFAVESAGCLTDAAMESIVKLLWDYVEKDFGSSNSSTVINSKSSASAVTLTQENVRRAGATSVAPWLLMCLRLKSATSAAVAATDSSAKKFKDAKAAPVKAKTGIGCAIAYFVKVLGNISTGAGVSGNEFDDGCSVLYLLTNVVRLAAGECESLGTTLLPSVLTIYIEPVLPQLRQLLKEGVSKKQLIAQKCGVFCCFLLCLQAQQSEASAATTSWLWNIVTAVPGASSGAPASFLYNKALLGYMFGKTGVASVQQQLKCCSLSAATSSKSFADTAVVGFHSTLMFSLLSIFRIAGEQAPNGAGALFKKNSVPSPAESPVASEFFTQCLCSDSAPSTKAGSANAGASSSNPSIVLLSAMAHPVFEVRAAVSKLPVLAEVLRLQVAAGSVVTHCVMTALHQMLLRLTVQWDSYRSHCLSDHKFLNIDDSASPAGAAPCVPSSSLVEQVLNVLVVNNTAPCGLMASGLLLSVCCPLVLDTYGSTRMLDNARVESVVNAAGRRRVSQLWYKLLAQSMTPIEEAGRFDRGVISTAVLDCVNAVPSFTSKNITTQVLLSQAYAALTVEMVGGVKLFQRDNQELLLCDIFPRLLSPFVADASSEGTGKLLTSIRAITSEDLLCFYSPQQYTQQKLSTTQSKLSQTEAEIKVTNADRKKAASSRGSYGADLGEDDEWVERIKKEKAAKLRAAAVSAVGSSDGSGADSLEDSIAADASRRRVAVCSLVHTVRHHLVVMEGIVSSLTNSFTAECAGDGEMAALLLSSATNFVRDVLLVVNPLPLLSVPHGSFGDSSDDTLSSVSATVFDCLGHLCGKIFPVHYQSLVRDSVSVLLTMRAPATGKKTLQSGLIQRKGASAELVDRLMGGLHTMVSNNAFDQSHPIRSFTTFSIFFPVMKAILGGASGSNAGHIAVAAEEYSLCFSILNSWCQQLQSTSVQSSDPALVDRFNYLFAEHLLELCLDVIVSGNSNFSVSVSSFPEDVLVRLCIGAVLSMSAKNEFEKLTTFYDILAAGMLHASASVRLACLQALISLNAMDINMSIMSNLDRVGSGNKSGGSCALLALAARSSAPSPNVFERVCMTSFLLQFDACASGDGAENNSVAARAKELYDGLMEQTDISSKTDVKLPVIALFAVSKKASKGGATVMKAENFNFILKYYVDILTGKFDPVDATMRTQMSAVKECAGKAVANVLLLVSSEKQISAASAGEVYQSTMQLMRQKYKDFSAGAAPAAAAGAGGMSLDGKLAPIAALPPPPPVAVAKPAVVSLGGRGSAGLGPGVGKPKAKDPLAMIGMGAKTKPKPLGMNSLVAMPAAPARTVGAAPALANTPPAVVDDLEEEELPEGAVLTSAEEELQQRRLTRIALADCLNEMALLKAIPADVSTPGPGSQLVVESIMQFIIQVGVADNNKSARAAMVKCGKSYVDLYGGASTGSPECSIAIKSVIETSLKMSAKVAASGGSKMAATGKGSAGKLPSAPSGALSDLAAFGNMQTERRQDRRYIACVILLGVMSKHMIAQAASDAAIVNHIRTIGNMLVNILLTVPSGTVQKAVADSVVVFTTAIKQNSAAAPALADISKDMLENMLRILFLTTAGKDKDAPLNSSNASTTSFGERKGAGYGVAACVKGMGIIALKQYDIVQKVKDGCTCAVSEAVNANTCTNIIHGSLCCIESFSERLGLLFEPYILVIIPLLLKHFSHSSEMVRDAAQNTTASVISRLSSHGLKQVLTPLLNNITAGAAAGEAASGKDVSAQQWKTRHESIKLLGSLMLSSTGSTSASNKQLVSSCLPQIIPKLVEAISDPHPKVKEAAKAALGDLGMVIKNPEVAALSPVLLAALCDPANKTKDALHALLECEFVHTMDTSSLAILIPTLTRALLRERVGDLKKKAAAITGNIIKIVVASTSSVGDSSVATAAGKKPLPTQQAQVLALLQPYISQLLPGLQECLIDPIPDVRATAAKALASLVAATCTKGATPGTAAFNAVNVYNTVEEDAEEMRPLIPWLINMLTCDVSPVERSGAAQGLAEVSLVLGSARMGQILSTLIPYHTSPRSEAREGVMWYFSFLPMVLKDLYTKYANLALPLILHCLSDDVDTVREIAYKAGMGCVTLTVGASSPGGRVSGRRTPAQAYTHVLLPMLLNGCCDEAHWRIRQYSVSLLAELLYKAGGGLSNSSADRENTGVVMEDAASGTASKMHALMCTHIDDKALIETIFSSIYISRHDVVASVRQVALVVWKNLVFNTPRTLVDIMPVLVQQIIDKLGSSEEEDFSDDEESDDEFDEMDDDDDEDYDPENDEDDDSEEEAHVFKGRRKGTKFDDDEQNGNDMRTAASRALGELVAKLGDKILPIIIPKLRDALADENAGDGASRQGLCLGLAEIVSVATAKLLEDYMNTLIVPALLDALLCESSSGGDDEDEADDSGKMVRHTAAVAFHKMIKTIAGKGNEQRTAGLGGGTGNSTAVSSALDAVIMPLIKQIVVEGDAMGELEAEEVETAARKSKLALAGLKELIALRPKELLEYMLPKIMSGSNYNANGPITTSSKVTITPVHAEVLCALAEATPTHLPHYYSHLVSFLVRELIISNPAHTGCSDAHHRAVQAAGTALMRNATTSSMGVQFIMMELSKLLELSNTNVVHADSLHSDVSVQFRMWGLWFTSQLLSCYNIVNPASAATSHLCNKAYLLIDYVSILLKNLLMRVIELDASLLQQLHNCFVVLTKVIPLEILVSHVGEIKSHLNSMCSTARHRSGLYEKIVALTSGKATSESTSSSRGSSSSLLQLPLFLLTKGAAEPFVTVYLHALLSSNVTQAGGTGSAPINIKECAAVAIGELVQYSDFALFKPYIIKTTGPLIRLVGELRNTGAGTAHLIASNNTVRIAILATLGILLDKTGVALKAFVPQLQTTFIKALSDTSSKHVRASSITALGKLLPMITRVDQIVTEVLNNILALGAADAGSSNDILISMGVKSTLLEALALVCTNSACCDKITMPVRLKVIDTCQQSLLNSDVYRSLEVNSTVINLNLLIGDFMGKAIGGVCRVIEPPAIMSLLDSLGTVSTSDHFSVIVKRTLGMAYALQGLQVNSLMGDAGSEPMLQVDGFKQQTLFPFLKECLSQDSGAGDELLLSEGVKTCSFKALSVLCQPIPAAPTKEIKRTVRAVLKAFSEELAASCAGAFSAECKIISIETIKLVSCAAPFSMI